MKRFFILILFIASCLPVYSGELDGKAYLKKGKSELDKGKYEDAISSLSAAAKEFSLLGDYALLWLSEAYHEKGNHEESLNTVRILLKKYPQSPLAKRSRSRELKEAEEISGDNVQKLFESFLKDYPGDTEMKYLYARWLKDHEQREKAKSLFKAIYKEAGPFSGMAYHELSPSDISVADKVKHASNLINIMDYKGAESVLRSALSEDDGTLKSEILRNLGLSLFRQKKYREAAEAYKRGHERYWELRSLYRAGEKETVNTALDELLKSRDKRMGGILVTVASDKRREGHIDEAIELYQNVVERHPSEKEDALWGMGWTYFLKGEYKKASDIFTRLHASYNNTRYLYWKARSLEAAGEDPTNVYKSIMGKEYDLYSYMSYIRISKFSGQPVRSEVQNFIRPVKGTSLSYKNKKMNRIEALLDLGFSKEALSEMVALSGKTESIEDIQYICSKMQELGEYKYLVGLVRKVPYTEDLHQFLYPSAYRDTIEGLSRKYNIDPLLVLSVIREESRFDADARSVAGALGLMQIMPHTAFRVDHTLGLGIDNSRDILKVKNNLHLGSYYLSRLVKEFGSYTYALAAYNAGEDIVKKWLQKGAYKSPDEFIEDIPYSETRNYVKRVLTTFFEYKRASAASNGTVEISREKL